MENDLEGGIRGSGRASMTLIWELNREKSSLWEAASGGSSQKEKKNIISAFEAWTKADESRVEWTLSENDSKSLEVGASFGGASRIHHPVSFRGKPLVGFKEWWEIILLTF